jgi:hypothetical protein
MLQNLNFLDAAMRLQAENNTSDLMCQAAVKMQVHSKVQIKLPSGYVRKVLCMSMCVSVVST